MADIVCVCNVSVSYLFRRAAITELVQSNVVNNGNTGSRVNYLLYKQKRCQLIAQFRVGGFSVFAVRQAWYVPYGNIVLISSFLDIVIL